MGILAQLTTNATVQHLFSSPQSKRSIVNVNMCSADSSNSTLYLATKTARGVGSIGVAASGNGFTTIPTVVFDDLDATPPSLTVRMKVTSANVQSGGAGYTNGDTLTVSGGTKVTAATLTVTAVTSGVITGISVASPGTNYTALPAGPVSVTGGTGTGASFTLGYGVDSILVNSQGSGFVDTPVATITGGAANPTLTVQPSYSVSNTNAFEYQAVLTKSGVLERTGILLDPGDFISVVSTSGTVFVTATGLLENV
jgi:hypothetical protein